MRFVIFTICAVLMLGQFGCTDKQAALDRLDAATAVVERSVVWMDAADLMLNQVEMGAIPWTTAWEQLRPVIPDNLEAHVDRVVLAGGVGVSELRDVIAGARIDRDAALAKLSDARRRVMEADDPIEVAAAATQAGAEIVALAAGSGVLVGVIGMVAAVLKALKKGKKIGASETAAVVATGRSADGEFDAIFTGDTTAARAMKAALANSYPEVRKGIEDANLATRDAKRISKFAAPASA